ncbi:Protein kinase domain-containing protein [Aphelenchoides besseyi]|nr:Protein kinase domain-containing protein [Aphelenchoides besseyi]KAI6201642.1 Protein kinase domain-containing protein [Aphelenchoides besseyi]
MEETATMNCFQNFGDSTVSDTDSTAFTKFTIAQWDDSDYRTNIQAGNTIGFYDLTTYLGRGNFAVVRLGRHTVTNDTVAVKVIEKARISEKRQYVIKREVKIMHIVHHYNIVRLFEYIETFNRFYIVMENAIGDNIHRLIVRNGPFNESTVFVIFSQIVDAVAHLHSKEIAHKDLKAENVIYDPQTEIVKIVDFGFSCFTNSMSTTFCGSLPYAAPELLLHLKKPYHAKPTDCWALGVLLYFMRTGTLPFTGLTPDEMHNNILQSQFIIPAGNSERFNRLLRGLLEPNPDLRFTIDNVMENNWLNTPKITTYHIDISHNIEYPNPLVQKIVNETFNCIVNKYNITRKELNEALDSGLHEPLTGIYRLT